MRSAALLAFALLLSSVTARGQACYGTLSRTTYGTGYQASDFTRLVNVGVQNGSLTVLNLPALDPDNIRVPFDQDVTVSYVYESAGGSHSLGWFYFDELVRQGWLVGGTNPCASTACPAPYSACVLKDADCDGVADFFQTQRAPQRPADGLFHVSGNGSGALPDLLTNPSYSDGGLYPHIPNLLEGTMGGGVGGLIFKLCDDDGDLTLGAHPPLGPAIALDGSALSNGIPDYDVDGDGVVGGASDRSVNLGRLQGDREIVFYLMMYYPQTVNRSAVGLTGAGTVSTNVLPFFSKSMLNPDVGSVPASTTLKTIDIGCGYPGSCGGVSGWLDQATLNRLDTAPYQNLVLPHEVKAIVSGPRGWAPHLFVGAPSTDPDRWLIGVEDLALWNSDRDYNDVVVLVQTELGGTTTSSQNLSIAPQPDGVAIPAADAAGTTITKIRLQWSATFPAPFCTPTNARIDLFWSVDDGATWHLAASPTASAPSGSALIDPIAEGQAGSGLRWRADFVAPPSCHPTLAPVRVGFLAVPAGVYHASEAIPLANTLLRGGYETPSASWGAVQNRALRGRLQLHRLSDPDANHAALSPPQLAWDAGGSVGPVLNNTSPDARQLFFGQSGATLPTAYAAGHAAYPLVLPPGVRGAQSSGRLVYDLTGDGVVDDRDAQIVVEWTRGWDLGAARVGTGRAGKLGAIVHSSPALVGEPGRPWWYEGTGTVSNHASERGAFDAFRTANLNRAAVALAGAADGMLHAFDAGYYHHAGSSQCLASERRGCFRHSGARRYGDGHEVWAFVPQRQLEKLKNNLPAPSRIPTWQPDLNPRAAVDGAIAVADINTAANTPTANPVFKTVAAFTHGRAHPFLSAVDVTSPTQPRALWATDWTHPYFNGTADGPALAPTATPVGPSPDGRQFVLGVSSGLADAPGPLFLFLIDATNGATVLARQLAGPTVDAAAYGTPVSASPVLGNVGGPALVDSDRDGVVDRAYLADTSGHVYRVDTRTGVVAGIYNVGQSVYAPIAVDASAGNPVKIYVAGGDHPEVEDALGAYRLYALSDGGGALATLVFQAALPAGRSAWSAPLVTPADPTSGTAAKVFVAGSPSGLADVCATGGGTLIGFDAGSGATAFAAFTLPEGASTGGLRAYDGHLYVNSLRGRTVLLGGTTWGNSLGARPPQQVQLPTSSWYEP